MDKDKWLREAKRWAKHAYCYEGMVDEFPEHFERFYGSCDPYEAVNCFATDYGLERADSMATWGINAGKKFVKGKDWA
jgi:hypothetical protein